MTQLAKHDDHAPQQAAMVSMIERVAMDPNVSIDKLERMLDMQERIQAQRAKAEHAEAKAEAMAEMPMVPMHGKGHNGRPYALLKDIVSVSKPVLARHGLALTWDTKIDGQTVTITAILTHRNGHEERVSLPLPADNSGSKNPVQAFGSTQTYGQRYTAQSILGLALGDDTEDDGRGANGPTTITEEQFRELRSLIDRAGIDEDIVLKAERLSMLTDLPAKDFDRVAGRLKITLQNRSAR
jgi:hypothetical protein